MRWWNRLTAPWRKSDPLQAWLDVFGGSPVKSGQVVNWQTALNVSTWLACGRVIAEGISQVPLKLFREAPDGKTRLPAKDHPLYTLLHRRPNSWQTSFEYRETLALHLVFCGNHFSFINRVFGRIIELIPFEPQWVTVKRDADSGLTYDVTLPSGAKKTFPQESIWHVRGPSWNSYLGLDMVKHAREALGLAMATEEAHARRHANGVSSSGTYSVEGTLNPTQHEQLTKWLKEHYQGPDNAGVPMVMDRNAKWLDQAMSGVDLQHLETRAYQVEEICRHLRVMPIMVGHSDKTATYASAEQMFLAHVVHTLAPWYERIEQSIDAKLLTDKDTADGVYAKFVEEGLLRGSLKDTAHNLVWLSNNGVITRNEARAKLDLNPLDGLDEPLTPANLIMLPDAQPVAGGQPQAPGESGQAADRLILDRLSQMQRAPDVTINQSPPQVTVHQAPVTVTVPDRSISVEPSQVNVTSEAPTVDLSGLQSVIERLAEKQDQTTATIGELIMGSAKRHETSTASTNEQLRAMAEAIWSPVEPLYDDDGKLLGARRVSTITNGH